MEKKIIVSMTSWPKRIGNVATVVKSLLEQDLEPSLIQINLSEDEFERKELDLPQELQELLSSDTRVQIEWLKGNTGVFKKIIPTLQKHYGKDYLLLSVDDDWIYRHDYIQLMVDYLEQYDADAFCLFRPCVIGNRIIYKSSCFSEDFWLKLTPEVIESRIDDEYIEHYLRDKGKKLSGFRPNNVKEITVAYNPIFPNSQNGKTGSYSAEDIKRAKQAVERVKFN